MTNTTTSKNLFHTLVFSTVLAAFASMSGVTYAADGRSSGSADRSSGQSGTTINRELEKLFHESGQEMPSMRTQDLPYATTPQMNRVRRVDQPAANAPKKKQKVSLFGKLFGRFRRDRRKEEEVVPEPPPIVTNEALRPRKNTNQQGMRSQVAQSRPATQPRPSTPQQHRSASVVRQNSESQVVRRETQAAPITRPAPRIANVNELPRLDLPDEQEIEDAKQKSSAVEDEYLDLDAVAEIPEVAPYHPGSEPEVVVEEVVEPKPQANPFTGVQLVESDEFVNPFEEVSEEAEQAAPLVDVGANPFMVAESEQAVERDGHSVSVVSSSREAFDGDASDSFDDFVAADEELDSADSQEEPTREELIDSRKSKSGFLGFCPVALCDRQELVDAEDSHKARFGLKTYHFSSAEAVQTFRKNPTHYAPVAGGADVVALVNAGEELAGSIRYAMWYQDRLYLFHSQETKDLFCEAPADFANQY